MKKNITIKLSVEFAKRLDDKARRSGLTVEELARAAVEDSLQEAEDRSIGPGDEVFRRSSEFVLRKNADLYRRLAQ